MRTTSAEPAFTDRSELIIMLAFARIDAVAFSIATGCMGAIALWGSTALLLLRGAPPGVQIGTHLNLISNYFPGYSVTQIGSLVGILYGFACGAIAGIVISSMWNLSHFVYLMLITRRRSVGSSL